MRAEAECEQNTARIDPGPPARRSMCVSSSAFARSWDAGRSALARRLAQAKFAGQGDEHRCVEERAPALEGAGYRRIWPV